MRSLTKWPSSVTLIVLSGLTTGLIATAQPVVAGAVCGLLALAALIAWVGRGLPRLALGLIGVCLAGYAFLGKGFAYLGVPPLFVGELALGLGLMAIWPLRPVAIGRTPVLTALLIVFMLIGAVNTVPFLGEYGVTALRDATLWAYGLFALITATLLIRLQWVGAALHRYSRLIPAFLVFAPLSVLLYRLAPGLIPAWPGSGVPVVFPKGGDLAVHLAGVMAFLMLGLHQPAPESGMAMPGPGPAPVAPRPHQTEVRSGKEWWWWALWLIGSLSVFTGRGALVTVGASAIAVVLLRPLSRWGRPLYLTALLLCGLLITDLKVDLGVGRELSVQGLLLNIESVSGDTGTATRDGSRAWRLEWWNRIIDYTVHGPYFWTGKGYGINLADADGFQVTSDRSLRSPHNGHMTILARSGVPGIVSWAALQCTFAVSLLLASWRARRAQRRRQAAVMIWIFVYWLAFMVNAAFDVFLEGPQGGIWFWCLFGFGLACLELERREKI